MPNTNAIVEKLKDVGLRHGEKAGLAVASTVFFVCIVAAAKMETIKTTADNIKAATKNSQSNLNRHEDKETIVQHLEEKGIKDSHFAQVVDEQVKTALVPENYKAAREWVSLEPGAGVIRDTPVLITASELYAYPGRGGFLVFDLDEEGNRIADDGKSAPKDEGTRQRRKKRRRSGGMMGGGSMMGGGMMGGAAKKKKGREPGRDLARAGRRRLAQAENPRQGARWCGKRYRGATAKDSAAEKEEHFKELSKGHRWVAITGVLDHAKLVANYREALKNTAVAHPNYRRLDLQRKTLLARRHMVQVGECRVG